MYSGLSLFDLDQTLLTLNSSFSFSSELHRLHVWDLPPRLYCLWYYISYRFLGLSLDQLHEKAFSAVFKGRLSSHLELQVEKFLDRYWSHFFYGPALLRLKQAQVNHHYVAILSSSPYFLVKPIAERLQVNAYYATSYLVDQEGYLIGIDKIIEGQAKAEIAQDLANQLKLTRPFLYAYSDSHLDLPILEIVGNPVGVNPDSTLSSICKQKNWEII